MIYFLKIRKKKAQRKTKPFHEHAFLSLGHDNLVSTVKFPRQKLFLI